MSRDTMKHFARLLRRPRATLYGSLHFRARLKLLPHTRNFTTGTGPAMGYNLVWNTLATSFAAGFAYSGFAVWNSDKELNEIIEPRSAPNLVSEEGYLSDTTLGGDDLDVRLEKRLRAEEASYKGVGGVKRYDVARVQSNEPTEDSFTHETFSNPWEESDEDWTAWGVFDGHLGWQTSQYLKFNLVSAVRTYVQSACNDIEPSERSTDASRTTVVNAIKNAFVNVDNNILSPARAAVSGTHMPLAQATRNVVQAFSGSCAILSLFDPTTRLLYVACVGDSRAVLGRQSRNPSKPDSYTALPLSTDQTGRSASEIARLDSLHPEEPNMVKDGRVLGMAVSRAFGDFQWKFDIATQQAIQKRLFRCNIRPGLQTPPYLTAEPVVTTTEIPHESNDFAILASDGFWDCVTNDQAVELVRRWMVWKHEGAKDSIVPSEDKLKINRDKLPGYSFQERNTVVKDENCATHLVRNVLGGGDTEQLKAMLRFEAPQARNMRDDITVQVIFFGNVS